MRKKILIVLLLLLIAIASSALTSFFRPLYPVRPCYLISINGRPVDPSNCPLIIERGFPFPFYFPNAGDIGLVSLLLINASINGFLFDTIFFLVLYSAIYFVYLKFSKKTKKK